jgi:uncharacterized protein
MLTKGAAKKVTIYLNEDAQRRHSSLVEGILDFLLHHGVSGATASRGQAGFGEHRVMHTVKLEARAEHLPVRIEFIESPAKVEEILPELSELVSDGLVEVQDTTVVKSAH